MDVLLKTSMVKASKTGLSSQPPKMPRSTMLIFGGPYANIIIVSFTNIV
jgi:hypothetical protein